MLRLSETIILHFWSLCKQESDNLSTIPLGLPVQRIFHLCVMNFISYIYSLWGLKSSDWFLFLLPENKLAPDTQITQMYFFLLFLQSSSIVVLAYMYKLVLPLKTKLEGKIQFFNLPVWHVVQNCLFIKKCVLNAY